MLIFPSHFHVTITALPFSHTALPFFYNFLFFSRIFLTFFQYCFFFFPYCFTFFHTYYHHSLILLLSSHHCRGGYACKASKRCSGLHREERKRHQCGSKRESAVCQGNLAERGKSTHLEKSLLFFLLFFKFYGWRRKKNITYYLYQYVQHQCNLDTLLLGCFSA